MPAKAKQYSPQHTRSGIGVDAFGGSVVDPTANVIALNNAASQRQDDLRDANNRWLESEIASIKELARLREMHARELREIETGRLNAIRQVDALAVTTAADRALAAIQTLALNTANTADTLRAMVTTTAASIATQTQATFQAITDRIAALEKTSYEGKGAGAGRNSIGVIAAGVIAAIGAIFAIIFLFVKR